MTNYRLRRRGRYALGRRRLKLRQSWKNLSREDRGDLIRFLKVLGALIAVIALIYYLGINGLTHLSSFWTVLTGDRGETQGDITAPPPPTFSPLPSYTKDKKINLSGFAEPAAEIALFINGEEAGKAVVEAGGTFSFSGVALPTEGRNAITATATDRAGNVSQRSAELVITLDTKPPELAVSSPKEGQKFSGEEKQITVIGKTEAGATVKVNEIQAPILADGSFRTTVSAGAGGEIKIVVVATDKAGNEEKVELSVSYTP